MGDIRLFPTHSCALGDWESVGVDAVPAGGTCLCLWNAAGVAVGEGEEEAGEEAEVVAAASGGERAEGTMAVGTHENQRGTGRKVHEKAAVGEVCVPCWPM